MSKPQFQPIPPDSRLHTLLQIGKVVCGVELDRWHRAGSQQSSRPFVLLEQYYGMPALDCGTGADNAGWASTHRGHTPPSLYRTQLPLFKSRPWIDGARYVPAMHYLVEAPIMIPDAGDDLAYATRKGLAGPLRIGRPRARKHDHVAASVAQGRLGQVGITKFSDRRPSGRRIGQTGDG